ncbi:MAG: hypothetical protein ACKVS8_02450 [Phycisphaerales bacterium]
MFALALCGVLAVPALAAPEVNMQVSLGWDGKSLVAERWCPLSATIDAGTTAMNAVLIVEYGQDATQRTQVRQAVSTTPGRAVPVQAAVCFGGSAGSLEVRLESAEGRVLARRVYSTSPEAGRGELPLDILGPPYTLAGTLGDFPGLSRESLSMLAAAPALIRDLAADVHPVSRAAMPVLPAAYESLDLLVVRASDAHDIDARAMAALRQWVLGGGRLVIMADGSSADVGMWLAASARGPLVEVQDAGVGSLPAALKELIRVRMVPPSVSPERDGSDGPAREARRAIRQAQAQARARSRGNTEPAPPTPPVPPTTEAEPAFEGGAKAAADTSGAPQPPPEGASASTFEPVAQMPRRFLTLSARARAEGWQTCWGESAGADRGLAAFGPMGLGMVAVVGFQPSRVAANVVPRATHAAWAEVLALASIENPSTGDEWFGSSGTNKRTAAALDAVLNRLTNVPPISAWVFVGIGISMGVLALMVGPVDFLTLRSWSRLPRSWATCLLWTGLAGVAAYMLPLVLRGGATRIEQLSVLDCVAAPGIVPLAFQSSTTTLWADSPLTGSFDAAGNAGRGAEHQRRAPGMWRGVSSLESGGGEGRSLGLPQIQMAQRPAALGAGGDDEWGGVGVGAEGETSVAPDGHTQARWTLRAATDERRLLPDISIVAAEGELRLIARGPAGAAATIRHAAVRTASGWSDLAWSPGAGAFTHLLRAEGAMTTDEPVWFGRAQPSSVEQSSIWKFDLGLDRVDYSPRVATALAAPGRRTAAIDARVAGGAWALVVLDIADPLADVVFRSSRGSETPVSRSMIVRWLMPLPAGLMPPAPVPSESTPGDGS